MKQSKKSNSAVLFLALGGLALLAACAPESSNSRPPGAPVAAATPLLNPPEPHGSMQFQKAEKPVTSNAPSGQDAGANSPADTPVDINTKPVSMERHPLCKDAFDPSKPQPPGLTCPVCLKGQFTQPDPKTVKLDLLFVADTSPSLESSRLGIARGIEKFVAQLPPETDYRVAVMAAHSDVSYDQKAKPSTGLAGKLIVAGNEPAVLKGSDYQHNMNALSTALAQKIVRMRSDAATDGGEVGLYSLNKGITQPQLSENQRLGFFRPDAGLAVIFISDENDICSYDVNYGPGEKPKPNVNFYKKGQTVEEKANEFYCKDKSGTPIVTNTTVLNKLLELKKIAGSDNLSQPLLISGIIYTDNNTIPTVPPPDEKYPQYFSEKEVGHGYLEMIRANGGEAVDLAKGNFSEGLRQIGQAAALRLEVKTQFNLKDGKSVDPATLCVVVDGRDVAQVNDFSATNSALSFVFNPDARQLELRGIGPRNVNGGASKVDVFYCEQRGETWFDPERYVESDLPTPAEHYRNLPVPSACTAVRNRISSGQLDHAN